ncbi:PepSY domain-containing protein [Jiella sonneratiae]|uniref:PepSY domain-containing protein n=1 Tax=Jiella sonneratiae TaxID=2816856 RepID=A0ABS3J5Q4_9HYPH|nr:PepSY domain-containing protein [Jiella sonneratiae]MBO0904283.1 PepSY domain-containing protein [Jiella sonneratiae]
MKTRTITTRIATAAAGGVLLFAACGASLAAEKGEGQADGAEVRKALTATIPLSQALAKAEQATGAKALDAAISDEAGDNAWEIELAKADGSRETVMVDASTGNIARNASDEAEGETAAKSQDGDEMEDGD